MALATLIAYKCLQRNWLWKAAYRAIQDNDPHKLEAILNKCALNEDFIGRGFTFYSSEMVGSIETYSLNWHIRNYLQNNVNVMTLPDNQGKWSPFLDQLNNRYGDDQDAPSVTHYKYFKETGSF